MDNINFKASVQYNDYTGTVAADNLDINTIKDKLTKIGLIKHNEFIIGIKFYPLSRLSNQNKDISVDYFILDNFNFENFQENLKKGIKPITKKINQELTFHEFFNLFKRFEGMLSWKGLIDQCDIDYEQ